MSQRQNIDPDAQQRNQARLNTRGQADAVANQQAAKGMDFSELKSREFGEFVTEPDINADPDMLPDGAIDHPDLESLVPEAFGKHLVLGNIEREDWEAEHWMDYARSVMVKQEFRPTSGPGSKCKGDIRQVMTGRDNPKPPLTPELDRRISQTFDERSDARSLAIGGKAFDGITRATAVSISQGLEQTGKKGMMGRLSSFFGG